MYGFHINQLYITLGGSTIWSHQHNQGDRWYTAAVTAAAMQGSMIDFIASRGQEYSGDIAVDNISLTYGPCWLHLIVNNKLSYYTILYLLTSNKSIHWHINIAMWQAINRKCGSEESPWLHLTMSLEILQHDKMDYRDHNGAMYNQMLPGDLLEVSRGKYSHWAVHVGM